MLIAKQTESKNPKIGAQIKDVSISMNWVFGFRTSNARHPLYFIKAQHEKFSTEKIVYYTAKIVVIYFPKLNEQKHYLEHEVSRFGLFLFEARDSESGCVVDQSDCERGVRQQARHPHLGL